MLGLILAEYPRLRVLRTPWAYPHAPDGEYLSSYAWGVCGDQICRVVGA